MRLLGKAGYNRRRRGLAYWISRAKKRGATVTRRRSQPARIRRDTGPSVGSAARKSTQDGGRGALPGGPRAAHVIRSCLQRAKGFAHAQVSAGNRASEAAAIAIDPAARRGLDLVLFGAVLLLFGIGVVMVYSASAVYAAAKYQDGMYFLKRQLLYGGAGLGALYVGWRIDYRHYRRWIYPLLGTSVLLLIGLLVPGLARKVDGATRWLRFAGISFQPSELVKVTLVLYLAHSLSRKSPDRLRLFSVGFLPPLAVASLIAVLVLKQPDLGSTVILMAVTLLTLLVAGTRVSYVLTAVLAAAPIAYHQIVGTPWRLRRLIAFFDPWTYRKDAGYQISESLMSVGSGGFWGLGLGAGKQKLFFLPAAHTDFVFAISGEELGFVGLCLIVALFAVLTWRGLRASLGANDLFGSYLAFGITATLSLQAAVHMAVVLGMVPTKGITLPFCSYGGSSLLVNLLSVGILLNVAARNPQPVRDGGPQRRSRWFSRNRRRAPRVVVADGTTA